MANQSSIRSTGSMIWHFVILFSSPRIAYRVCFDADYDWRVASHGSGNTDAIDFDDDECDDFDLDLKASETRSPVVSDACVSFNFPTCFPEI
jgi:hypothetical protein